VTVPKLKRIPIERRPESGSHHLRAGQTPGMVSRSVRAGRSGPAAILALGTAALILPRRQRMPRAKSRTGKSKQESQKSG